ncbi:DUF4129 domain-containing protein [Actinoplanes couchii]|uniref:Protein-glutamine gamma-glutamyltransferase-like C-terminal domain-containing protein n=1 Tax=Actinoplanes couchii TaxID=403638 RepID=A0ABQ3XM11_9ACTN|nr:DUF4129 domain-containing protein [Actinoplanes couchii]MDR6319281.1 hypothetical protein [Actinoplanes couchii]GID59510.1 hypothetical protein Aco03nite_079140 [Actinoplanes couchii]
MRGYEEFLGDLFEKISPPMMLLILFAVTGLIAAGWYFYPAWIPRRLPRFKLPRWRRTKKKAPKTRRVTKAENRTADSGDNTVEIARGLADQLAGQGRYAEAIRERLRETVADLTRAGVIDPEPGTTAAELTDDATAGRPGVGPALTGATGLFSGIWYGRQPAGPGEDQRMRELTTEVRDTLHANEGR